MEIEFAGKTFLEVYTDGKKRYSGLGRKGSGFACNAKNSILFKISSNHITKIKINGNKYTFSQNKKPYYKIITWRQIDQEFDRYSLIMKDFLD